MYSCIILAAGESERMGELKPFLMFNEKWTFLEYHVTTYKKFGIEKPIIVVNEKVLKRIQNEDRALFKGCRFILNEHTEKGRFYSLKLGLDESQKSTSVFIQNVDNPFIDVGLLQKMANSVSGFDFVVPQYKGKTGHPVLLSPKLVEHLLNNYTDLSILSNVLKSFIRHAIQVDDPKVLLNVNTPEDYEKHFSQK